MGLDHRRGPHRRQPTCQRPRRLPACCSTAHSLATTRRPGCPADTPSARRRSWTTRSSPLPSQSSRLSDEAGACRSRRSRCQRGDEGRLRRPPRRSCPRHGSPDHRAGPARVGRPRRGAGRTGHRADGQGPSRAQAPGGRPHRSGSRGTEGHDFAIYSLLLDHAARGGLVGFSWHAGNPWTGHGSRTGASSTFRSSSTRITRPGLQMTREAAASPGRRNWTGSPAF